METWWFWNLSQAPSRNQQSYVIWDIGIIGTSTRLPPHYKPAHLSTWLAQVWPKSCPGHGKTWQVTLKFTPLTGEKQPHGSIDRKLGRWNLHLKRSPVLQVVVRISKVPILWLAVPFIQGFANVSIGLALWQIWCLTCFSTQSTMQLLTSSQCLIFTSSSATRGSTQVTSMRSMSTGSASRRSWRSA